MFLPWLLPPNPHHYPPCAAIYPSSTPSVLVPTLPSSCATCSLFLPNLYLLHFSPLCILVRLTPSPPQQEEHCTERTGETVSLHSVPVPYATGVPDIGLEQVQEKSCLAPAPLEWSMPSADSCFREFSSQTLRSLYRACENWDWPNYNPLKTNLDGFSRDGKRHIPDNRVIHSPFPLTHHPATLTPSHFKSLL